MCKVPTRHGSSSAGAALKRPSGQETEQNSAQSLDKSSDFRSPSMSTTFVMEASLLSSSKEDVATSIPQTGIAASIESKSDEEKNDAEVEEKDDEFHDKEDEHMKDDEDLDLEQLVASNWQGQEPTAPLLRRQKRRQRQRANAKVGRALRRFVVSRGHRLATYYQLLLDQAQREIVAYVDFIFGPLNLPTDQFLNNIVLDRTYKSAKVEAIVPFSGIQRAISRLGALDADLQLAIVVDSLRWAQSVRCGPVCYPDGSIVFCFRVKSMQQQQQLLARQLYSQELMPATVVLAPAAFAPGLQLCMCVNCSGMVDPRFGFCGSCGLVFE